MQRVLLTLCFTVAYPCFSMTLEEKVGQLFVIPVITDAEEEHLEIVHNLLNEKKIGSVVFMQGTSKTQKRVAEVLKKDFPSLLTFQDAEWGTAMRLRDMPPYPKNYSLGKVDKLDLLYHFGFQLARECRLLGVEGNFAPVVDVHYHKESPITKERSFGSDPRLVALKGVAVMDGMRRGGLLTCAKHFPGHGATQLDSHLDLPTIEKMELYPFKTLIGAGVDMIMTGHLLYPPLSPYPATLSPEILNVLRKELSFKGVVISDSLTMKALTDHFSYEEICERALLAGVDLLLFATSDCKEANTLLLSTIPALIDHIISTVPEEIIDQKCVRIQKLKNRHCFPIPEENPFLRPILWQIHKDLVWKDYEPLLNQMER